MMREQLLGLSLGLLNLRERLIVLLNAPARFGNTRFSGKADRG